MHVCSVPQWCPTLWDPMDCSPPSSSVPEIFQARVGCHFLLWGIFLTPGIKPKLPALHLLLWLAHSLNTEPSGKPPTGDKEDSEEYKNRRYREPFLTLGWVSREKCLLPPGWDADFVRENTAVAHWWQKSHHDTVLAGLAGHLSSKTCHACTHWVGGESCLWWAAQQRHTAKICPGEAVSPCALQDPVVSQVPCRRPPSKHQDQRAKSFPPAISAQHPLLKKLNTESASKRKKLKGPDSFFTKQAKSLNLELNSNKSISTFYLIFCLLNIMLIHFVNLNEFLHLLGVYTPLFFQTLFLGNIASPPGILWMRVQFLRRSWYCSPGTYEMGLFQ